MKPNAGLCASCAYARIIVSDRKSEFLRCEFSKLDVRFPKYPQLPVIQCRAFTRRDDTG